MEVLSPWRSSAHGGAQPKAAGRTGVAVPWAAGLYGAAPCSGDFLASGIKDGGGICSLDPHVP